MKKRVIISVTATVVLLLVAGLVFLINNKKEPIGGPQENTASLHNTENELLERLRSSVVMITVGEYHGSGVIVENDGKMLTIATVAHLMEGYDQGIITFKGGKVGFGDVVYINREKDLSFLSVSCDDLGEDILDAIRKADIDESKVEGAVSTEVYLVGSANGTGANATKGTLASADYYVPDFDMRMLYLYCDVFEGMSGSGCFDGEGFLIGLLAGGSDASEAVCISVKDMIEEMKEGKSNDQN